MTQSEMAVDPQLLIDQLRRQRDSAVAQTAALREVLKAIATSPDDTQPVFELIARHARELCGASVTITEYDGALMHLRATAGHDKAAAQRLRQVFPRAPGPDTFHGRTLLANDILHIRDTGTEPGLLPAGRAAGIKSGFHVPLRRDGRAIGVIGLARFETGGFDDAEIAVVESFAEQASLAIANAITLHELRDRTAQLTQRNFAFAERIDQQAATIDVLKAMSASPGDPQPVFDLISVRARELCGSLASMLFEFDGELLHLRSWGGWERDAAQDYLKQFPARPTRATAVGRSIVEGQIVHIRNVSEDVEISQTVRTMGVGSTVAIPLMRDGHPIGVIAIGLAAVGGFSDDQIVLLRTFAEQAVIAITSTETYHALQTRTADLQESLEYQTATSDVLKVISRSTFDLQPVLDTLVETAARLCRADSGLIAIREDDGFRVVAMFAPMPDYAAAFRGRLIPSGRGTMSGRVAIEGCAVHIPELASDPEYALTDAVRLGGNGSVIGVPLLRDGGVIGTINLQRHRVRPYAEKEIALVSTFADQAVIAIENTGLLTEQREALERQTATADIMRAINASPGDPMPVFQLILEKAHALCGTDIGSLGVFDGTHFRKLARRGYQRGVERRLEQPYPTISSTTPLLRGETIHVADITKQEFGPDARESIVLYAQDGLRAWLEVPLWSNGQLLGSISGWRRESGLFSEKQVALLENFADHAVIALENARLLTEQREALEQQTATAEVLQVINASPGNLVPVFDKMLERALGLCGAAYGALYTFDGERFHMAAIRGVPPAFEDYRRRYPQPTGPDSPPGQLLVTRRPVQVVDNMTHPFFVANPDERDAQINLGGVRSVLALPLLKDGAVVGQLVIYRKEPGAFPEKQVALLENFAAQAVIAMENARLLDEIRQRQEELRVTFENMGDGVALFDAAHRLVAWNRRFQDILDLPDDVLSQGESFADYIRTLATRGEFGPVADADEQVQHLVALVGEQRTFERARPDGRTVEVRNNPVADGGFVLIYADITERKRAEAEIAAARDAAEQAARTIEAAYRELKAAQANLVQAEKMASLGQLTAGIAHEIKNPLNFVNNFAALSVDLLGELKESAAPGLALLDAEQRADVDELAAMLTGNLEKIAEHGRRADGIVRSMLEHSRGASGERRSVDLNTLVEEALNLAYHGARAQDQSFNITLERDFADGMTLVTLTPQDITRVLLNLCNNGFYAARKRQAAEGPNFAPTLRVTTRDRGNVVEVRVRDNGIGVAPEIRDRLFQPFFTTKPTGEGTGLGLSISYDIVVKQHGGGITVDSEPGEFTEFVVTLPCETAAKGAGA